MPPKGDSHSLGFNDWYHTIELPDGTATPGEYDHQRYLHHYGFPRNLEGQRVLDVGPADGFFSFEFERRGASEVVAVEIDPEEHKRRFPNREGGHHDRMLMLRDLLSSEVKIHYGDIYDLADSDLGLFDLVFCGDVLLHLSNPVRALVNLRSVTRGTTVIASVYNNDPFLRLYETLMGIAFQSLGSKSKPTCACFQGSDVYWLPTRRGMLSLISTAGFPSAIVQSSFRMSRPGKRSSWPEIVIHATA